MRSIDILFLIVLCDRGLCRSLAKGLGVETSNAQWSSNGSLQRRARLPAFESNRPNVITPVTVQEQMVEWKGKDFQAYDLGTQWCWSAYLTPEQFDQLEKWVYLLFGKEDGAYIGSSWNGGREVR